MKTYAHKLFDSPVGELTLVASDDGLAAILWKKDDRARGAPDHPILLEAERQLREYFAGRRKVFDLKLDLAGTDFQRRVWGALLTIPYGETRSYIQVARQIGRADRVRAVGAANGRNPIPIIVPCHRVIGANGALVGFAAGLQIKAQLLALEAPQAQLRLSA